MRRAGGIIILIFTVLAVLTGFSLPALTADHQDRQMLSQVRVYESEEIRFPTSYHVMDCIRLFSEGYERVDLAGGREHTAEEICEIAEDTAKVLNDYGFFVKTVEKMTCSTPTAFLAVRHSGTNVQKSEDNKQTVGEPQASSGKSKVADVYTYVEESASDAEKKEVKTKIYDALGLEPPEEQETEENFSAIVWECRLAGEDEKELTLWIDDLSGKMISARYFDANALSKQDAKIYVEIFRDVFYSQFVDFCTSYYGFETADIVWSDTDFDYSYYGNYYGNYILFHMKDKTGSEVYVDTDFSSDSWEFNPS